MSGRFFKGILLLLVLLVAGFLASPISSGEHPWGSDRGDDERDTDVVVDTGSTDSGDTIIVTPDTTQVLGGFGDELDLLPAWFSVFTRVWSSMSVVF